MRRDAAAARRGRSAASARHPPRAFAGAERACPRSRRATVSAFRSSTKCARSGRTRRSTTARRARAACATARRARSRPMRCARADHVTTICEGLRDDIVARGIAAGGGHGDPQRGRYRSVPVRRARPDDSAAAAARPARRDRHRVRRFVLCVRRARSAPRGAARLMPASPATCSVLLVGGGPQEAALRRARAQQLGMSATGRASPAAFRTTKCSATTS